MDAASSGSIESASWPSSTNAAGVERAGRAVRGPASSPGCAGGRRGRCRPWRRPAPCAPGGRRAAASRRAGRVGRPRPLLTTRAAPRTDGRRAVGRVEPLMRTAPLLALAGALVLAVSCSSKDDNGGASKVPAGVVTSSDAAAVGGGVRAPPPPPATRAPRLPPATARRHRRHPADQPAVRPGRRHQGLLQPGRRQPCRTRGDVRGRLDRPGHRRLAQRGPRRRRCSTRPPASRS